MHLTSSAAVCVNSVQAEQSVCHVLSFQDQVGLTESCTKVKQHRQFRATKSWKREHKRDV